MERWREEEGVELARRESSLHRKSLELFEYIRERRALVWVLMPTPVNRSSVSRKLCGGRRLRNRQVLLHELNQGGRCSWWDGRPHVLMFNHGVSLPVVDHQEMVRLPGGLRHRQSALAAYLARAPDA